ncbi:MAG: fructosamine kinase family protein [Acidobacteria bacterium]|nr:fructosamine kinase family protein [Acidobacteriota bacterium]
MTLPAALERSVLDALAGPRGDAPRISQIEPLGGGWHHPSRLQLADGRRCVLKWSERPGDVQLEREAEGLEALRAVGALRVAEVLASGVAGDGTSYLLLEAVESGPRPQRFFEDFGRGLALLHRSSSGGRFGYDHDNFLGAAPQPNTWCDDWVDFWRCHRLGFQLDLARRNGLADATLSRLGDRLLDHLGELIAEPDEPACLLHGDLWSGNFLCDAAGRAVLVDPAVYRGRREAELAMTRLFGGFGDGFYRAYDDVWPLAPGAPRRIEVYQLYHLLNHLNLFGEGYRGQCLAVLRRLV